MRCEKCGAYDSRVIDSRMRESRDMKCRRRECRICGGRFSTIEVKWSEISNLIEGQIPVKIKNAVGVGGLSPFHGMLIAALAENKMNLNITARALCEHRATIEYHVQCIKDMTGLDPMRFDDLAILLALIRRKEE